MRIALVAPLGFRVPPAGYGGVGRVVGSLANGLIERGHDVALFAAGGSDTKATLYPVLPAPISELPGSVDSAIYQAKQVAMVEERADDFDIIHSHVDHFLASSAQRTPVLATLHNPLDLPGKREALSAHRKILATTLNHTQHEPVRDLPNIVWLGTVHNGIDPTRFDLGSGDGGYLAYLGRVYPRRETDEAMRIAVAAGARLKLAGRVFPSDRTYWNTHIAPLLAAHPDQLEWVGEHDDRAKNELLGAATALLMPAREREVFGLAFLESLACGTPVIGRPRGAIVEVVEHRRHGYLVDDTEGLIRATRHLIENPRAIDRQACRDRAISRFSVAAMVEGYLRIYHSVLSGT